MHRFCISAKFQWHAYDVDFRAHIEEKCIRYDMYYGKCYRIVARGTDLGIRQIMTQLCCSWTVLVWASVSYLQDGGNSTLSFTAFLVMIQ